MVQKFYFTSQKEFENKETTDKIVAGAMYFLIVASIFATYFFSPFGLNHALGNSDIYTNTERNSKIEAVSEYEPKLKNCELIDRVSWQQ